MLDPPGPMLSQSLKILFAIVVLIALGAQVASAMARTMVIHYSPFAGDGRWIGRA
jgi:hypothetical protein